MVPWRVSLPLLSSRVRWVVPVLVAGAVFWFSVVVAPSGVPASGFGVWDKVLHFAAYFVLGVSLAYASVGRGMRFRVLLVVVVPCLYGLGVEGVQWLLPYRFFDVWDAVANGVGGVVALFWFVVERRVRYVRVVLRGWGG